MSITFTTTGQASASAGIKALVYGESGAGKTFLCGTAPAPFIISAEAGLLSLRHQDIPAAIVTSVEDLAELCSWAYSSKEAQAFQTICIDSLSEVAEVVLAHAKKTVKDPRQAYGELIEKMLATVRAFRDLPNKNVLMLAKLEMAKDEISGITRMGPFMPGTKVGPALPYLFDEVFYLGKNKTPAGVEYRYLQTEMDIQRVAKDRSGSLDSIEPPDFTHIVNKIRGN